MNTIQQIRTNNNPNFGRLQKIKFSNNFNPEKDTNCAKALRAFNESVDLRRFFAKYDVIADFSCTNDNKAGFLKFYFKKIEEIGRKLSSTNKNNETHKYKLMNIVATDNYKTMATDIKNLTIDELLEKTSKKSKKINILEKDNISETLKEIKEKVKKDKINFAISNNFNEISNNSKKIIKKTSNIIEDNWTAIRKENKNIHNLEFKQKIDDKNITLKPIYNGYSKLISLEIDSNDIEKIILDTRTFDFKYEKIRKTEFGSATIENFDSKNNKKSENIEYLNEIIENYLPKINRKIEIKYKTF